MLSLTRTAGKDESIILSDKDGNPIAEIRIPERRGDQVTMSFRANKDVIIKRSELYTQEEYEQITKTLDR